jgi:hypothetical protein
VLNFSAQTDTGPIGAVTIEDSLAYDNGTLSNGRLVVTFGGRPVTP